MAVKVLGLLGLLACLTVRQQPVWASDIALWSHAVVRTQSARPALNLAIAYRKAGEMELMLYWLEETHRRAMRDPDTQGRYDAAIQVQFAVVALTGYFPCDSPTPPAVCSS